jgi:hypothetical protein
MWEVVLNYGALRKEFYCIVEKDVASVRRVEMLNYQETSFIGHSQLHLSPISVHLVKLDSYLLGQVYD